MERLGLNKKSIFNIGIDSCLRNIKYNKVNLIKFEDNKETEFKEKYNGIIKKDDKELELSDAYNSEAEKKLSNYESVYNKEEKLQKNKKKKVNKNSIIKKKSKSKKEKNNNNSLNIEKNKRVINGKIRKKGIKKKLIIVAICVIIPLIIFEVFTTLIEPSLIAMCEIRANSIGVSVSSKAVKQVM